jgi:acyl-CoA dehydrogenase
MENPTLLLWIALATTSGIFAYHRHAPSLWLTSLSFIVLAAALFSASIWLAVIVVGSLIALGSSQPLRLALIARPVLRLYRLLLPSLSDTERVALESGTVGFEGELFSGTPNWAKLLDQPAPALTPEEQSFLDGPVERACAMTQDWIVTHKHADLMPEIWEYLRAHRFFGMIIPKIYGGLGFSALAHHRVIEKLASCSTTLSATVAVPNSLGPGELLLHYGTMSQKAYYLPRLAAGIDLPCFALTSPTAGSDATSITDQGVVCMGDWAGAQVLGVRLNFEKRYITLAPVATLIGLAFRLYDPQKLLSDQVDRGITLALVPRNTPGVDIGRRHFPLNVAFQNGPVTGRDVFIPLAQLIGEQQYIGRGWQMLVECLSVGRAITLPSSASGSARMAAVVTGAYSRIRKQFGLAVGRFEGVEEALARCAGKAYAISALAEAAACAVDRGEKPAVVSAIAKYHCTEMGRQVVQDAMDIHGGKGIMLGPNNYLGRAWQGAPIGITVEGANIMTRSLMIFGQGAILCHPWIQAEMRTAQGPDDEIAWREFDRLLLGHAAFLCSNAVRALWFGLTGARIGSAPGSTYTHRFYRKLNRYSACLALVSDVSMLALGGRLKFKEALSARLGDVLSQLYIASSVLRRFEYRDWPKDEQPLLAWALHDANHSIELALSGAIRNFPLRPLRWALWLLVFPWGRRAQPPSDRLGHVAANCLLAPSPVRDRLATGIYLTPSATNPAGRINSYLPQVILFEPLERKWQKLVKAYSIEHLPPEGQLEQGFAMGWITAEEASQLRQLATLTADTIKVDDFAPWELASHPGIT